MEKNKNYKDRKMLTIKAKLFKTSEVKECTKENGDTFNVLNFTLVKKYGDDLSYINCSVFNDKIQEFQYEKGDEVKAWGYFDVRQKGEKTYKNFIVMKFHKGEGTETTTDEDKSAEEDIEEDEYNDEED